MHVRNDLPRARIRQLRKTSCPSCRARNGASRRRPQSLRAPRRFHLFHERSQSRIRAVPEQEVSCGRLIQARRSGTCAESQGRGSHAAPHSGACLVDLPFRPRASEVRQSYVDRPASSRSGVLRQVTERQHLDPNDLKRSSLGGTEFGRGAPNLCTRRRTTLSAENEQSPCLYHLVPERPYRGRTRMHSCGMVSVADASVAKTTKT